MFMNIVAGFKMYCIVSPCFEFNVYKLNCEASGQNNYKITGRTLDGCWDNVNMYCIWYFKLIK